MFNMHLIQNNTKVGENAIEEKIIWNPTLVSVHKNVGSRKQMVLKRSENKTIYRIRRHLKDDTFDMFAPAMYHYTAGVSNNGSQLIENDSLSVTVNNASIDSSNLRHLMKKSGKWRNWWRRVFCS